MRIIHTADLHLDSRLETNLDPIKAKERKRELLLSFENLITYATNNKVDAILISGDLFDRPRTSTKTKEYILDLIEEAKSIEFYIVYGNHDENIFSEHLGQMPNNLHIFGESWQTYTFQDINITGISGNQITKATYDNLVLEKDKINIVMLHGDINSSQNIPLTMLKGRYIDYLALGHIHKYQKGRIDERGIWAYPGCLEGRGFDEEGIKGFILLTINDNNIESKFVPLILQIVKTGQILEKILI